MDKEFIDQTAKQRILSAAAAEFAERSFDGARIDEIAKRAGVNKALIYYYYKSKEELLSILFQETAEAVFAMFNSDDFTKMDFTSKDSVISMLCKVLDILEERQNIIRVVLMECAKRTPINDRIFDLIEKIIENMFKMSENTLPHSTTNKPKAMATEFFTGIMPLLDYVAYHEIWMDRFSIEESTLRNNFIESFMGTHFAYTVVGFPHNHEYQ